jgi:hypothetical protein
METILYTKLRSNVLIYLVPSIEIPFATFNSDIDEESVVSEEN